MTLEKIETPKYEDFSIVGTANNMIFIGRLDTYVSSGGRHYVDLKEYCQLAMTQSGMNIVPAMFPATKMTILSPAFIIKISDMEKQARDSTCDSLRKYFIQKNSGLVLGRT